MVNAHVAEESGWHQETAVLHRTGGTLSREGELGWMGQRKLRVAEVAILLPLYQKSVFVCLGE